MKSGSIQLLLKKHLYWKTLTVLAGLFLINPEATTAQASHQNVKYFEWLVGLWENTDRKSFEYWTYNDDSSQLKGVSFKLRGAEDSLISERLTLTYDDQQWYYIADVPDNGRPVRFLVVNSTPRSFRSLNNAHDYPTYIDYQLQSSRRLRTEVGNVNRKQVFSMQKRARAVVNR